MKNLSIIFRTLSLAFMAILFASNVSTAANWSGTWVNVDANTRGLTKAVITGNNTKIQVWGSCSPTDCDWKQTRMSGSGNNYSAYYNQGFATRRLSIAKVSNGQLCIIVKTKYKDNRRDRTARYFFKKRPTFTPYFPVTPVFTAPVSEDCVSIDWKTAKVKCVGGRYKIVDGPQGNHYAFDFGNKRSEAYKALDIIKCYRITQSCFVGRPGPSLNYLLKNGKAPQGPIAGEDCVSFNPNTAKVKCIGGRWKIVDGSHWIFDFGSSKAEATKSLQIIKKHKFTKSCYVGRPGPSFEYMRK